MRTAARTAALTIIILALAIGMALPASARLVVEYGGKTSAPEWNRFGLLVLKKDSGQRFIAALRIRYTLVCEDASTEQWETQIRWFGAGPRLGDDGSFSFEDLFGSDYSRFDGTVQWRQASGTAERLHANLTDDLDTQLCTTGDLTWTAERKGIIPLRLPSAPVREGTGFMSVRVTRGVPEIVELIEP